jgi:hypothetical protein
MAAAILVNNKAQDVNKAKEDISNMFKREYASLAGQNAVCQP